MRNIDMRPLESLCFVDCDEIHRIIFIPDDMRDGNIEVIFLDKGQEFDTIMEREEITTIFVVAYSLDKCSHIRKVSSIEYISSIMVSYMTEKVKIEWRGIVSFFRGKHIDLERVRLPIVIIVIRNREGIRSGDKIDDILESVCMRSLCEFLQEVRCISEHCILV